jgi:hypothetical protein
MAKQIPTRSELTAMFAAYIDQMYDRMQSREHLVELECKATYDPESDNYNDLGADECPGMQVSVELSVSNADDKYDYGFTANYLEEERS